MCVDFEDFVEVLVGDDVFDEDDEQGVVVGQLHVVGDSMALSAGVVASPADGRELASENDILRFFGGVDVGDGDCLGSAIEGAIDEALGIFVNADYGVSPHRSQARVRLPRLA